MPFRPNIALLQPDWGPVPSKAVSSVDHVGQAEVGLADVGQAEAGLADVWSATGHLGSAGYPTFD